MTFITIELRSGFMADWKATYHGEERGYAASVSDAIEFLSREVLPKAIKHDHQAHDAGYTPRQGWGSPEEATRGKENN